jgi:hypothetical protein
VIYLLDADTLIRAANTFYRLKRVRPFWDWLQEQGDIGNVKISIEQYEEVTAGNDEDELVSWLKGQDVKKALLLDEDADPALVAKVTLDGYGKLDERGIEEVGRDPFLVSYGLVDPANRIIVTFENSSPSKKGKNRKVPDVCTQLGVKCCDLFGMIEDLDFTVD